MASTTAEGGLAGRYALALFELAQEAKAVDAISQDLAGLARAMQTSPELARLVKSPLFSAATQAKALEAVLEKMGVQALTVKFVLLLARKRRLATLSAAIKSFESHLAKARGETQAEVVSARALSDGEVAELKTVLKARLGKEPRLHARIDPSLLGGLVVKVGSRMIDSSLRTKLDGLRSAMKG